MSTSSKDEVLKDLQRVFKKFGQLTRSDYRVYGKFGERQVEKHFGNFRNGTIAAGAVIGKPTEVKPVEIPKEVEKNLKSTTEVTGDKMTLTVPKTRIDTLEKLIEHFKVDLTVWHCERFIANAWEMGYKDNDGNADTQPLYQVKANFVRRRNLEAAQLEINALKEIAKVSAHVPAPIKYRFMESGNMLEVMLPDLHAGKLAWSKETGYQNYDLNISIETYRRALDSLLTQVAHYHFDKIILGVGNDLLQSDNIQGTTYSGTKVDTDGRYHKVYVAVRKMLVEAIEKLRRFAPVEVKLVPGNHDTLSTFTLGDSLECYFAKYTDVIVDNSPTKAKTIEWGACLLTLVHGHEGKQQDYGAWQASANPAAYGRTKFREIHVGHKHKSALDEKFGSRVRTLSALCPPDAWHSGNLFVGNIRTAEAFVWSKERGLIAQFYHNELD